VTVNGAETYAYDGLDRQIRHTAGGSSWNYIFDGSNERVAKAPPAPGAWTYTLRDEGNRVATEYSGTMQSRDNVFLGNLAVVSYANSAVAGNGPVWTFYSSDHLGTPRLVTDLSGTAVETRKSWPYGEDATAPGTFQRLRFALMERDTEGSRYYDHARNHEFNLGRFLTPDLVGGKSQIPQTWNRYTYTLNNPIKLIDPDGLDAILFARNSGRGATNFGHTALRVYGKGYDVTYDFGRYRGTSGFLKYRGEGILRVWKSWSAFQASQTGKGQSTQVKWQTPTSFDKAVISSFNEQISQGQKIEAPVGAQYSAFKLSQDYNLLSNNCTTICLGALDQAEEKTGFSLQGLEKVEGENDPRELYDYLKHLLESQVKSQKDAID
jgi:RHS repeat-associated protein